MVLYVLHVRDHGEAVVSKWFKEEEQAVNMAAQFKDYNKSFQITVEKVRQDVDVLKAVGSYQNDRKAQHDVDNKAILDMHNARWEEGRRIAKILVENNISLKQLWHMKFLFTSGLNGQEFEAVSRDPHSLNALATGLLSADIDGNRAYIHRRLVEQPGIEYAQHY